MMESHGFAMAVPWLSVKKNMEILATFCLLVGGFNMF